LRFKYYFYEFAFWIFYYYKQPGCILIS